VTLFTNELLVFTLEWVIGLIVVIEGPQQPAVGGMAITTLLTHAFLMHIIRLVAGETLDIGFLELAAQVAQLTGSHTVDADEWKTGNVMFKKDLLIPRLFVMAIAAVLTQVLLMHIDRPVTVDTDCIFQGIHRGGAMTGAANQIRVLPLEGEVGIFVMIEIGLLPTLHIVALLTFLAVAPFMLVILFMAGITGFLRFLLKGSLDMAAIALHCFVLALEWKFGVLVVVEDQFFPFVAAMTFLALVSMAPVMHVVDQVAAIAILWSVFVMLIGMTQLTVGLLMLADQFEVGVLVVIKVLLMPTLLAMALVALFSQFAPVRIVGLVAVEADRRGIPVFLQLLGVTEPA
jgi:hypothetical protein